LLPFPAGLLDPASGTHRVSMKRLVPFKGFSEPARERSEAIGARSVASGPVSRRSSLFQEFLRVSLSSMHRCRAGSLQPPMYPFGLASARHHNFRTRPMISSGAGGPFTQRSEAPTLSRQRPTRCRAGPFPDESSAILPSDPVAWAPCLASTIPDAAEDHRDILSPSC
jgi:hypothetical protein